MQQVFLGAPNNYSLQLFIAMPLILLTFIETKHSHPMISSCNKTHFNAFLFPSKNYKFNLCCYILPFLRDSLTDSVCAGKALGPSWNLTMALLAWYCRYGVSCVVSAHFKNKLVISLKVSHILPNGLQGPCFAYYFFLASRNDFQLKAWHTAIISNNNTANVCCVYENWFCRAIGVFFIHLCLIALIGIHGMAWQGKFLCRLMT